MGSKSYIYNKETTVNDTEPDRPQVQLEERVKKVLWIDEEEKSCLEEAMAVERNQLATTLTDDRGLRTLNNAAKVEEELMFSSR